MVFEVDLPV